MEQVNTKLIERYFEGELDEQELSLVAEKLKNDPAFAEAFQLEEDLLAGITAAGNEALRQRLNAIHETVVVNKEAPVVPMRTRRTWVWLVAAAFIGAVVLGKVLWDGKQKTPEQLYAQYAVHEFDFTEKGGSEAALAKAEGLLKEKKYAEALPILQGFRRTNQIDGQILLAIGISFVEVNKLEDAIDIFDSLSNNPTLINEAQWYKALACLKGNQINESIAVLHTIPDTSTRYKNANNLIDDLEKLKQ